MIIPVTLASASTSFSSSANPKLPPGLVKLSNDEIVLIELQGSLEVDLNDPSERNGKLVGKLKMDEATNKPTLLIGHHLLEGKIAALPKPYAILVRTRASITTSSTTTIATSTISTAPGTGDPGSANRTADQTQTVTEDVELDEAEAAMAVDDNESRRRHQGPESSGDQDHDGDDDGVSLESSGSGTTWKIAGIVKKKIVFSKRPMPVINRK
ncbi:hypothetical protein CVT25_008929 [Psilocybe cyanescens]|uniref:Chromosome transmission fidelity protein 8 n=1 Tax=Psilocybe cyanescens TaxID=93625 RepID=A0A409XNE9_PSICY|nr:hypothetical protein CVT25_008929 [Psilocybe cyanescens]